MNVTALTADTNLQDAVNTCVQHLNNLRNDAKKSAQYSDILAVAGGSVGAAGGIIAAFTQDQDVSAARGAAIVGAVGALVAVLSKAVDSPTFPLAVHVRAERHWIAALKLMRQMPGLTTKTPKQYRYVQERLADCTSGDPPAEVPLPPDAPPESEPLCTESYDIQGVGLAVNSWAEHHVRSSRSGRLEVRVLDISPKHEVYIAVCPPNQECMDQQRGMDDVLTLNANEYGDIEIKVFNYEKNGEAINYKLKAEVPVSCT